MPELLIIEIYALENTNVITIVDGIYGKDVLENRNL
jgi:hypothetical protein